VSNGASFSISFSSIFRIAQLSKIDADMTPNDKQGADPLPQHLGTAKINFTTVSELSDEVAEESQPAKHVSNLFEKSMDHRGQA
jgi:hypothetical protein